MSDEKINLSLAEVYDFAKQALMGAGASEANASSVAQSTVAAETEGTSSHGMLYVPIYCGHLQSGKVDGKAVPVAEQTAASAIRVDAKSGFAHPAIDVGFEQLISLAKTNGIAVLNIYNSYNCGVLGYHVRQLAKEGVLGLGFTNAPASIAPVGGNQPVIGTNPIAMGVPNENGEVDFVIDQSASSIAKSEIMLRAREGRDIPEGWALDSDGNATTDPQVALKGSMVPSGGYKGFGIGLIVEMMAAALSGATLGKDSAPFGGTDGTPCNTGQCFIAINPDLSSGGQFYHQVEALRTAVSEQSGARMPGSRKQINREKNETQGVFVSADLLDKIKAFTA
jgi:(2R)-3-sulfolactate dehydrogenase (NADP+)